MASFSGKQLISRTNVMLVNTKLEVSPPECSEAASLLNYYLPEPDGSGFRSGLMFFMTQTDSRTSLTALGGLVIVLTTVISEGLSVFSAEMAASSAGIASARSAEHSSLIPCATEAASLATFSSAATT